MNRLAIPIWVGLAGRLATEVATTDAPNAHFFELAVDASAVTWTIAKLSEVWCTAATFERALPGSEVGSAGCFWNKNCPSSTSDPIGAELPGQWACSWRLRVRKRTPIGTEDTQEPRRTQQNRRHRRQKRCRVIRLVCE